MVRRTGAWIARTAALLAVAAWPAGCEKYSQDSAQAVVESAKQMVAEGRADRLPTSIYAELERERRVLRGYITSVTPTFTWGPDPQNDKWHVTIFEGLTTDPSAIVLAPRDLTTESYVVPASTPLADATTYTWLVVGEIIAGFTYSESRTFTVCYADCDQSTGPGVLDIFDFLCFQNSFVNGKPYACDCDTTTGQLVCDIFDFLCFQDAFVGGCP